MAERTMETLQTDVLVVGGGAAAAKAAVAARAAGADTALAVKGRLGAIGTRGGGGTASGTAMDWRSVRPINKHVPPEVGDPDVIYAGVLQLGLGLADNKLARILIEELPAARQALVNHGISFNGSWAVGIVPTMAGVIRRAGVRVLETVMIADLLLHGGACVGAVGLDADGKVIHIVAGSVILGTGGDARLFKCSMGTACVTGDGYAMGYRAGAQLMNMEFRQIFLGTIFPNINNVQAFWELSPKVTNGRGEEFLARYLPPGVTLEETLRQRRLHGPTSTRDRYSRYVDLAILEEVRAGRGSPHGGIYMDLTSPEIVETMAATPVLRERFWDWLDYRGVPWQAEKIEVAPCQHCCHGGLRIDENAQTTVPGLYAVGEAAAGPHGADRYWGMMIGASQVFGARAGSHAAQQSTGKPRRPTVSKAAQVAAQPINTAMSKHGNVRPDQLRRKLQQVAWKDLLVVKDAASLRAVLQTVEAIRREAEKDMGVSDKIELIEALELQSLLTVGEMEAGAALMRTESRGGHFRTDFPERDDDHWLKAITIKQVDGAMELGTEVLDPGWKDRPGDMGPVHWG